MGINPVPDYGQPQTLEEGGTLAAALPFTALSVQVDNPTQQWLHLTGTNGFVPPGQMGMILSLPGVDLAAAEWLAPPGVTQPVGVAGQAATLRFYSFWLPPSSGSAGIVAVTGSMVVTAGQVTIEGGQDGPGSGVQTLQPRKSIGGVPVPGGHFNFSASYTVTLAVDPKALTLIVMVAGANPTSTLATVQVVGVVSGIDFAQMAGVPAAPSLPLPMRLVIPIDPEVDGSYNITVTANSPALSGGNLIVSESFVADTVDIVDFVPTAIRNAGFDPSLPPGSARRINASGSWDGNVAGAGTVAMTLRRGTAPTGSSIIFGGHGTTVSNAGALGNAYEVRLVGATSGLVLVLAYQALGNAGSLAPFRFDFPYPVALADLGFTPLEAINVTLQTQAAGWAALALQFAA